MPLVNGTPTVLAPPEGYEVDFANPQRQAVPAAYWIAGVGTLLTLLLLGQRLYTKIVFVGKFQLDDVFLVLAWVISTIVVAFCVHMFANVAGGVHAWEISVAKYNVFLLDVYLAAAIYIIGGSCAKVSLLIFYLRLSPQQWFRTAAWATLLFISGYTIGIFFALIFACKPIALSWDVRITSGKCINRASLYIATAAVNIISDVVLFILPLPIVFTLQIPRRQKVGLLFIFVLGSLTIVTSIVRVTILPKMLTSPDQTWVISWASVWIIVEANLLVICASLPTLRKFCRHVAPWLVGESSSGRASSNNRQHSSGNPPGLRTIGMISTADNKKGSHNKYSRFDFDDDSPGDNDGSFRMESYPRATASVEAHELRTKSDDTSMVDDGSERAIIDIRHKDASSGHNSARTP